MGTDRVKEIVEHNKDRVKIINTGVKAFTRCEHKGAECDFRIAQEGALMTLNFIKNRKLYPAKRTWRPCWKIPTLTRPPRTSRCRQNLSSSWTRAPRAASGSSIREPTTTGTRSRSRSSAGRGRIV